MIVGIILGGACGAVAALTVPQPLAPYVIGLGSLGLIWMETRR